MRHDGEAKVGLRRLEKSLSSGLNASFAPVLAGSLVIVDVQKHPCPSVPLFVWPIAPCSSTGPRTRVEQVE